MWYIFGLRWTQADGNESPDRVYKIAHAISDNCIDWQRDSRQTISDVRGADECQALPSVIYLDGMYHMYFCHREAHGFRDNPARGYRIGYAYSKDMNTWTRDDSSAGIEPSDDGWDSQMQCYPHVFNSNGTVYMLYNGNEFGRGGFGLAVLVA